MGSNILQYLPDHDSRENFHVTSIKSISREILRSSEIAGAKHDTLMKTAAHSM